jgi:uncharacterized protein (TIGR02246 family)
LAVKTIWLIAVMFCAVGGVRAEEPAAQKGDAAAIRELYGEYDAAWNTANVAQLAMIWSDDADHVEPDGRAIQGRATIKQALEQRLAGDLKGTRSQQSVTGIRFVAPDVAVVDVSYEVSGAHDAQGKSLPAIQGRYVDIWVKRRGTWYIAADRPVGWPATN